MAFYRKRKNLLNTLLIVLIALVALFGGLAIVNSITSTSKDDDGYVVVSPKFEIGNLTADGEYEETKLTLYTKDSIECESIKVNLDFDNTVNYQLFFYDENDTFISSTDVLEENCNEVLPEGATHCRVMIIPLWDDDVKDSAKELNVFKVRKYTKQLQIKVLEITEKANAEDSTVE